MGAGEVGFDEVILKPYLEEECMRIANKIWKSKRFWRNLFRQIVTCIFKNLVTKRVWY